jgi:hypothetical protein
MPYNDILARDKDLRKPVYRHEMLVKETDFEAAQQRVLHFFERYQLVRYSKIDVIQEESLAASEPAFMRRLQSAVRENRRILHDLMSELQAEGVLKLDNLEQLPQGYKTKMLHVITHFLDGFFGIDTFFYNLEDDMHWVTEEFQGKITSAPSDYWLLSVRAKI